MSMIRVKRGIEGQDDQKGMDEWGIDLYEWGRLVLYGQDDLSFSYSII